ncbi:hypothetical protein DSM104299_00569 [Baekduia alba]|uniref:hypothetical protein n=1 Tax=Baekduia alba TaxID=2997333 RepID=UPI00234038B2|nr:hypothetical protein [Baekduia alba]WCB91891.1 hypothetical protein DSM104299_00569 [Baekduia alba]
MLPVLAVAAASIVAGCPVFPASNPWNQDISHAPVAPRSAAYVKSIGLRAGLHPDFASTTYGIPFRVVPETQKPVPIHFTAYGASSDKGPYPVPLTAPVEAGSDRHVVVLQRGTCKLYELFGAHRAGRGWNAAAGARFDLRTGALRPARWTSADAAGLPIFPGLARADEAVGNGEITHALRVTVPRTQKAYISPARHYASPSSNPDLPPMGLRLRLKASFDTSRFHGQARVILSALKRYGMIVADNGSPWYITGAPDRRWDDDDLHALGQVSGSAFEAVQTGAIER